MAIISIADLKAQFEPGDRPGSSAFIDLIDTLADDTTAIHIGTSQPSDGSETPLWFHDVDEILYVYTGTSWVAAGSASGGSTLVSSATAPSDTSSLWLDTSDTGSTLFSEADLETYNDGNMATNLIPDTNAAYDLGSAEYKWRYLFTSDIVMSNEDMPNDVDGTWGSYVIQEGENDLFLINKRNGKVYKFDLTEVDPNGSA